MGKLKNMWSRIVDFHKSRLVTSLPTLSEEEYQKQFDGIFSRAKKLSDFIGIIVRWSFVQFALYYFINKFGNAENILSGTVYFYCMSAATIISIIISVHVYLLTLIYWSNDIPKFDSKIMRIVILIVSILVTIALMFGVHTMVRELASASQILGTGGS